MESANRPYKNQTQVLLVPRRRSHESKSPITARFSVLRRAHFGRDCAGPSVTRSQSSPLLRLDARFCWREFADKVGFKTVSFNCTCLLCNSAVMPVICCFIPSNSAWCPSSSVEIRSFNCNIEQQSQVRKWNFERILTNKIAKAVPYSSLSNIKKYLDTNFLTGLHNYW